MSAARNVMNVCGLLLSTSLLLAACTSSRPRTSETTKAKSDTLWLWAARPANDAVHAADREADFIRRYGAANVRRDSIGVGEGFFEPGVVIFPSDPRRRLEVIWGDSIARARPRSARTSSYATKGQSRWVAYPGVALGTCLAELERINGGPFTMFGFGFDGSGTVHSWQKGRLDTLWKSEPVEKRVWLRLEPTSSAAMPREIVGDKLISSTLPAMRAVNPCVREISVVPR